MKSIAVLALAFSALATSVASAGTPPGYFEYTARGGLIPNQGGSTVGISVFPLTMNDTYLVAGTRPDGGITWMELEMTGLTHTNPWDLDIYLIDPFGQALEIMTDRGDQIAIVDVDLTFNDKADVLPPETTQIFSGTYLPEDSDNLGGFSIFSDPGTDAWILLVIDDSESNQGGLDSFTLRGVPEPATLSLLAAGALTTFLRRRR